MGLGKVMIGHDRTQVEEASGVVRVRSGGSTVLTSGGIIDAMQWPGVSAAATARTHSPRRTPDTSEWASMWPNVL